MSLPFTIQLERVPYRITPIPLVTIFRDVKFYKHTVKTTSDENTQNINSKKETSPFKSDRKIGGP